MKILLVDDHPLFREGLRLVLQSLDAEVRVIEAADARSARATLEGKDELDLIVVDLALPDAAPFDVLVAARRLQPQVPVVVVTATESRYEVDRAAALGAQGYLFKSTPRTQLLAGLRKVLDGGLAFPQRGDASKPEALTERQLEVLRMLSRGMSNREIASALDVAENTVKVHLATIYRLLGVTRRTSALLKAQQAGLLEP